MQAAAKETEFDEALSALPDCCDVDPLAQTTLDDLRWLVLTQLDLIEEGQDSTEGMDPNPLRRWLKKYGRPQPE